uniref:hypothetical protein n=1 Tax=Pedobacter schmidteae TaxID=2201271 RepID=UPI000EB1922F|nr:hypothetical protein [Pedobacter schmidteae]
MKKTIYALTVAASMMLASSVQAQTETLTNKTVTDLIKAGLEKSVIITTINNAPARFDVSANGLIALKNAKVPNEIITAMVEKSSGVSTGTSGASSSGKGKPSILNHPHFGNQPLEKVTAQISTKIRGLGYGGTDVQYQLDGEAAKVRVPAGSPEVSFTINTGNGTVPSLTLYKAEVKKGSRIAITAKGRLTGMKASKNMISCNSSDLGNGVIKLSPAVKLEKGEYVFINVSLTGAADTYAFGVE